MKSLDNLITELKKDPNFEKDFDRGYEDFKIGIILKAARVNAGLTQAEVASRIKTKKSSISRIENHAEDIRLSTLERFAAAVGKKLEVKLL